MASHSITIILHPEDLPAHYLPFAQIGNGGITIADQANVSLPRDVESAIAYLDELIRVSTILRASIINGEHTNPPAPDTPDTPEDLHTES